RESVFAPGCPAKNIQGCRPRTKYRRRRGRREQQPPGTNRRASSRPRESPMKPSLLLSAWPYVSVSLLALGIAVRYLLERKQMAAVREEMSEAWAVIRGSRVWHGSAILLVAGHALILALPQTVLAWGRNPVRLYLLEALGFVAGIAALGGWAALLWR